MPNSIKNHVTSGVPPVKRKDKKQAVSELANHQKHNLRLSVEADRCIVDRTQAKIRYEQDAIRSYEHFQATGLFVTIEEMEDWATSLSASTPQPLPQCHK